MNESGPGPSDQERAFAALNLAGRGDSPEAQKLLQRRKNRAIRIRIAWMLGALIVGGAIGLMFRHRGSTTSHGSIVAPWRTVAGMGLLIAGILLEVVVVVARVRSGQFKAGWRSPSLVLSRPQRRQILRQIRGRAAVDEPMLPVSRQLAELLRRQRLLIGLFIALPLIFLGQALPYNVPFRWWMALILIVFYAASSVQIYRDTARAERFLKQYPNRPSAQP